MLRNKSEETEFDRIKSPSWGHLLLLELEPWWLVTRFILRWGFIFWFIAKSLQASFKTLGFEGFNIILYFPTLFFTVCLGVLMVIFACFLLYGLPVALVESHVCWQSRKKR